jgi:hypothetical protein
MERAATLTAWAAAGLGLPQELKAIIEATPDVVRQRGGDGKTVLHGAATRWIAFRLTRGANASTQGMRMYLKELPCSTR